MVISTVLFLITLLCSGFYIVLCVELVSTSAGVHGKDLDTGSYVHAQNKQQTNYQFTLVSWLLFDLDLVIVIFIMIAAAHGMVLLLAAVAAVASLYVLVS